MAHPARKLDVVLLGATGYTGKLCAEYICENLNVDLSWAIAGRNERKLSHLLNHLKTLNPDRVQPLLEVVSLVPKDLESLVQKTKIIINTIGPYYLYSSPIVEACVKHSTHYLDATGESPWVLEMIRKHHDKAVKHKAIIVPSLGIESAPSDLLVRTLAHLVREELSVGIEEVTACVYDVQGAPSGGTLATVLGVIEHYSMKDIAVASGRWTSSPVHHPSTPNSEPMLTKALGVRSIPGLGTLTTSISAGPNLATVQRSWGLLEGGRLYGPRFQYHEYAAVRNVIVGIAVHIGLTLGTLALLIPPVRWLIKRIIYAPGEGPTREDSSKESIEFRAIAKADQETVAPKRVFGRLRWDGGLYSLTGLFLAEAAIVLLKENDLVKGLHGGLLTPATLGKPYINRLKKAGLVIEAELIHD